MRRSQAAHGGGSRVRQRGRSLAAPSSAFSLLTDVFRCPEQKQAASSQPLPTWVGYCQASALAKEASKGPAENSPLQGDLKLSGFLYLNNPNSPTLPYGLPLLLMLISVPYLYTNLGDHKGLLLSAAQK